MLHDQGKKTRTGPASDLCCFQHKKQIYCFRQRKLQFNFFFCSFSKWRRAQAKNVISKDKWVLLHIVYGCERQDAWVKESWRVGFLSRRGITLNGLHWPRSAAGHLKKQMGCMPCPSLAGVMPSPLLFHFPVGRLYSNTVRQSSICNNLNTEQKHDNSYVSVSRRKWELMSNDFSS